VYSAARSGKCCIIFESNGSSSAVECDLANPFLIDQINNLTGHGVAAKYL
jgi:hypothetical protein